MLRVIVCDSEETADKDWIAGMNAAGTAPIKIGWAQAC